MPSFLIALSGGADSVCLLLHMLARHPESRVEAAHCNFHLRGTESDRDEGFVRELCRERGVTLHVADFDTRHEAAASGESVEMAARRLRYRYFLDVALSRALDTVCTAHHAADQAETLLMALARGCGPRSFGAMPDERLLSADEGNVRLIRPLLHWTKGQILAFLADAHQTFVEDSTNRDVAIARNRVRHAVLPELQRLNPAAVTHLAENASYFRRRILPLYERAADEFAARCLSVKTLPQGVAIHRLSLGDGTDAALLESLTVALLSREGLTESQSLALLHGRSGAEVACGGKIFSRGADCIAWAPQPEPFTPVPLREGAGSLRERVQRLPQIRIYPATALPHISRSAHRITIDADAVQGQPVLRRWQDGESLHPLGLGGTKLVADCLSDRRIPVAERRHTLVVSDERGILWLVGHTIDARCAIRETTRRVLEIDFEPVDL